MMSSVLLDINAVKEFVWPKLPMEEAALSLNNAIQVSRASREPVELPTPWLLEELLIALIILTVLLDPTATNLVFALLSRLLCNHALTTLIALLLQDANAHRLLENLSALVNLTIMMLAPPRLPLLQAAWPQTTAVASQPMPLDHAAMPTVSPISKRPTRANAPSVKV